MCKLYYNLLTALSPFSSKNELADDDKISIAILDCFIIYLRINKTVLINLYFIYIHQNQNLNFMFGIRFDVVFNIFILMFI